MRYDAWKKTQGPGVAGLPNPLPAPPAPPAQGGGGQNRRGPIQVMSLTSTAWTDGGTIPAKYTQAGAQVSPPLAWTAPDDAVSFVLIARDADAAIGNGTDDILHWMLWNIPKGTRSLPEGVPQAQPVARRHAADQRQRPVLPRPGRAGVGSGASLRVRDLRARFDHRRARGRPVSPADARGGDGGDGRQDSRQGSVGRTVQAVSDQRESRERGDRGEQRTERGPLVTITSGPRVLFDEPGNPEGLPPPSECHLRHLRHLRPWHLRQNWKRTPMRAVRGASTAVGRRNAVPVVIVRVSTALLFVMLNRSNSARTRDRAAEAERAFGAHVEHGDVVVAARVQRLGVDRAAVDGAGRGGARPNPPRMVRAKFAPAW